MRLVRALLRTLGGVWSVLLIVVTLVSLSLNVAMTVLPGVLAAVAGVVSGVTGVKSVVTRAGERQARLSADLAAERAARKTEVAALERKLAGQQVTYRGRRVAMREAVKDTSERVIRRTTAAAGRNIGATFGEAIPVYGAAVIVAATAWELHDSCAMLKEMRALDAAFNPDDPIDPAEVCGMKVPDSGEIWHKVAQSPSAIWTAMRDSYDALPTTLPPMAGWLLPGPGAFGADGVTTEGNDAP